MSESNVVIDRCICGAEATHLFRTVPKCERCAEIWRLWYERHIKSETPIPTPIQIKPDTANTFNFWKESLDE
jgi:hypothetical protein